MDDNNNPMTQTTFPTSHNAENMVSMNGAQEKSKEVDSVVVGTIDLKVSEPSTENKFNILEKNPQSENLEMNEQHYPEPAAMFNDVSVNSVALLRCNRDGEIEVADKAEGLGVMQSKPNTVYSGEDKEVEIVDKTVGMMSLDGNQLENTNAGMIKSNGVYPGENSEVEIADKTVDLDIEVNRPQNTNTSPMQSNGVHSGEEANPGISDGEADDLVYGTESANNLIEELEQESGLVSHTGAGSSLEPSQRMDGLVVTDSEEGDDEEDGKELFDSLALASLFKAALFSAEENLSDEEKTKLDKLQQIRVKYLRLVHKLGLSTEESVAQQVLYRLMLLGGRRITQSFNLEAAKLMALHLESKDGNELDFPVKILVLGKSGVGKSATINSIFGDEKASVDPFGTGTGSVKEVNGYVNGVNIKVIDTPGLKSSVMEQAFNKRVLSTVQKLSKKSPPDVVLYVDRLDEQTRDLNDVPMLKTVTSTLGNSIWQSVIVTLTHGCSTPPDGPSGTPLSYDGYVSQRFHAVQQSIAHAEGDLRMISPNLMDGFSIAENHPKCRKNHNGQKILPNGQMWKTQLLLLCYSMKILSEANALFKPQEPFDLIRKLYGYQKPSLSLPYVLSSMLQSRDHPKLSSVEGGDGVDSDVDLDDFSDSDGEEDEYDQLPTFKPLKKRQISKLSKEHRKAYFEEYDYRVKLLQKKIWREQLKRMREMKRRGKDSVTGYDFNEDDPDSGASAPISVPLPDRVLPASFDGDNPAYRYRFLEPTSQFLARPVLSSHVWDHDCGYDGVNLEHSLAIINRFPAMYTVQVTKDKKDFTFSLDSSISAKHGDKMSTMAGFDIQSVGFDKQLVYTFRGETKLKNLKKNKAAAGVTFTVLGENVVSGIKIEDHITLGKQYALIGSAGAVKSQQETAYGANIELQRREADYPIGQVQSTMSMSLLRWRGDWALGLNGLAQFSVGRNSKVAVRAGINNKMSGQVTVITSSSEHLSLALAAVYPIVLSVYRKLWNYLIEKKYSRY